MEPLIALTRKNVTLLMGEYQIAAFDALKQCLKEAPVLRYPDFGRPFLISTDASNTGIGAVLSQVQEDAEEHPVAYASRTLTSSERNYSVIEKEGLAVVWAVQYFKHYIYGQHITVRTDHKLLHYLL